MTQPLKKDNKENKDKTERKNKKDTNKNTSEQEMEAKKDECPVKGHQHELNKCPLGNSEKKNKKDTNKSTSEQEMEGQEAMEGVIEANNKRKKDSDSDNARSPDRDGTEAVEVVK